MEHGTFLGWIGDDVLHSLYRIADVCVVPSIYEPFGLVALEAMASGCPCIVADTGGLREVVPHDEVGLRFRSRDPEALARWSSRVLTDGELRERLVAEASEHVRSFDWADVAARTAALYEELARPRPRVGSVRSSGTSGSSSGVAHRLDRVGPAQVARRLAHAQRRRAGMPRPTTALAGTSLVTTA